MTGCPSCNSVEHDLVDEDSGDTSAVFCLDCGEEYMLINPELAQYKGYVVGLVVEVDPIPKKDLKKVQVRISLEEESPLLTIVTNAKHVGKFFHAIFSFSFSLVSIQK